MKNKHLLLHGALTLGLLSGASAHADEAEDQSAAFAAQMEALSATLGIAASGTIRTVNADGSVTMNVGLENLKMLVVRENEDGSLSTGHSSSADDAVEFLDSDVSDAAAEE
ncbi:MAG: hypothetical protein QNJ07_09165 [Woeseiaceae bacterium]|nr:hypothetical protein [Woeseiaceae bacterium]